MHFFLGGVEGGGERILARAHAFPLFFWVLSTAYIFVNVSLSPDVILLGLMHQLTNSVTCSIFIPVVINLAVTADVSCLVVAVIEWAFFGLIPIELSPHQYIPGLNGSQGVFNLRNILFSGYMECCVVTCHKQQTYCPLLCELFDKDTEWVLSRTSFLRYNRYQVPTVGGPRAF